MTKEQLELREVKESVRSPEFLRPLIGMTASLDQATTVLTCADAIADKALRTTVAVTAARGRGKSAALGLAIACAVGYGYSNIFITAPAPDNLKTLFEFVIKGLEAIAFVKTTDFDVVTSTVHGEKVGVFVCVPCDVKTHGRHCTGGVCSGWVSFWACVTLYCAGLGASHQHLQGTPADHPVHQAGGPRKAVPSRVGRH